MDFFEHDHRSAVEAREYAQSLAFGPISFQAARALVNLGLLAAVEKSRRQGITVGEAATETGLSVYGTRVLLEAGLGIGLVTSKNDRFFSTRTGHCLLHDQMTQVNFDFVNDVCYQGFSELEKSVREGRPAGLKTFGDWPTIYEALSHLPETARESWLKFDHYYSDASFAAALPIVFKHQPRRLLDLGGNTGRWALHCVHYSPEVRVCIADLPGQLEMADMATSHQPGGDRITGFPINLLDPNADLPQDYDALWMSQFLDCFSEGQIRAILGKCRLAMPAAGRMFILEPLWDRQKFRAAASSLQSTSLYFTALANGNSQMYASNLLLSLIRESGFEINEQHDHLGVGHSLIVCQRT